MKDFIKLNIMTIAACCLCSLGMAVLLFILGNGIDIIFYKAALTATIIALFVVNIAHLLSKIHDKLQDL